MTPLNFIPVAQAVALFSKDPSTKVGAVVIDSDNNILSTGFNGFPRKVIDSIYRLKIRDLKLSLTVHAEANAIAQAARTGVRLKNSTMIVSELHPCSNCAKLIIQAGITKVYVPRMKQEFHNEQWFDEKKISDILFKESGVEVCEY